ACPKAGTLVTSPGIVALPVRRTTPFTNERRATFGQSHIFWHLRAKGERPQAHIQRRLRPETRSRSWAAAGLRRTSRSRLSRYLTRSLSLRLVRASSSVHTSCDSARSLKVQRKQ